MSDCRPDLHQEDGRSPQAGRSPQKREEQERSAAAARRAAERAVQEKTARLRALRMAKKIAEKPP